MKIHSVLVVEDELMFREFLVGWLESAGFHNARTLETHGPSPLVLADKP